MPWYIYQKSLVWRIFAIWDYCAPSQPLTLLSGPSTQLIITAIFVISDSIKCHICEHKFLSKNALKCHMRLHTGVKPYECPYCGERFRTSGHRKAHIYSIHPAVSETEVIKHDHQSTSHIRLVNSLLQQFIYLI